MPHCSPNIFPTSTQNGFRSRPKTGVGHPLPKLMLQGGSPAKTGHFGYTSWGTLGSPFLILFHTFFDGGFRRFPEAIQTAVSCQKWCPKWSERSPKWNRKGSKVDCRKCVKSIVFIAREAHWTFFETGSNVIFRRSHLKRHSGGV